ncbi:MAG: glycoside-pentoside-hexuronide (GPH):cation symporter [Spirochaetia bacterium]|jgi:melibiose permease/lactose/raffinose/galactose permease|nr:glycoside-pentoside-hexuronide (GPH):cation symporter [Spirochaetia bacterium]
MNKDFKRNMYSFGLGTVGRDMIYTLVSMYLIYYLTEILQVTDRSLWAINAIILSARVFDAFNDPIMGVIVDNTHSKYGKFKPWIAFGALSSGLVTVLLFADFGLSGASYVALFGLLYLSWGITFTTNDISYWSMMPTLTLDQKEREKIGAFARITANIGMFAVVVGIVPLTNALGVRLGNIKSAWLVFAVILAAIMWAGQSITLFGVRESRDRFKQEDHTSLKGMLKALFGNDQLLVVALSMALFMIGYVTTTSFGIYFFKYAYGNEAMYSIFALVLGISQLTALSVFPLFSKRYSRKTLYSAATVLVFLGYLVFFVSPMNMVFIGLAGVLMFVGQAFIQLLMLMFLADSIEYGQWKLGKRNESVTFAVQPFINKMGGAISSGVVGAVVIISGINAASTPQDVSSQGLLLMKIFMLAFPLVCIVAGYLIWRRFFRIDEAFYTQIVSDLKERGQIRKEGD